MGTLEKQVISKRRVIDHGEVQPSRGDVEFTNRLTEAGRAVEWKLLDHLLTGGGRYYRFSDKGLVV